MLWEHQATPAQWRNISQERIDLWSNLFDREQALVGYLLTRETSLTGPDQDDVLGYSRSWTTPSRIDVNITPEQLLRVGDEVTDVLASYTWPEAATWVSLGEVAILSDLETQTGVDNTGIVHRGANTTFLSRTFYLDDGSPAPDPTIRALWDMDEDLPASRTYTLAELFPELAPGDTLYALEFDVDPARVDTLQARVVDGARFLSTPVLANAVLETSVGNAPIFFSAPVSSPTVEPTAINTISGNPKYISTLKIKAWHWNGQPLGILVNCSALNGDDEVYLTWHPDSTYTADIASVTAADNIYYLPFRAEGTDGLLLYGEIEAVVDGTLSQSFKDYSDSTDVNVLATEITAEPLAVMPVNPDKTVAVDMIVTSSGFAGKYFAAHGAEFFVPQFVEETDVRFNIPTDYPRASTPSSVSADFDGDGHEDFFASHSTDPRLYRWNPTAAIYEIVTATAMPAAPDSAFAAAWGDYNRDGWIDLAVAGSTGSDSVYVYRNELGVLELVQTLEVEVGAARTDPGLPYSLLWVDLNPTDGGQMELIASHMDGGVPSLKVFSRSESFNKTLGLYDFSDTTAAVFPGGVPHNVAKLVLADLDGDGDQDLLVARSGYVGTDKLLCYVNLGGYFQEVDTSTWSIGDIDEDLNGVLVSDMDPDGKPDIVTVPAGAAAPRLLLNRSSTTPAFTEEVTSLPTGAASGGLAYDWLGGKPNLYLAKGPTGSNVEDFFYGYEPEEGVTLGKTVRVRIGDTDIMNSSGIGTRVEVEWNGKHAYQWINGGEGRRGQQPRDLVFILGHVGAPVITVRALWPDGVTTDLTKFADVADTFMINRAEEAVIDETSITASFLGGPHDGNWYMFEWDADRRTSPEVIFFRNDGANRSACQCPSLPIEILLNGNTPDVQVNCYQTSDGVYHHRVVWMNRCCVPLCSYLYQVQCNLNGVVTTSAAKTFRTPKICPQ